MGPIAPLVWSFNPLVSNSNQSTVTPVLWSQLKSHWFDQFRARQLHQFGMLQEHAQQWAPGRPVGAGRREQLRTIDADARQCQELHPCTNGQELSGPWWLGFFLHKATEEVELWCLLICTVTIKNSPAAIIATPSMGYFFFYWRPLEANGAAGAWPCQQPVVPLLHRSLYETLALHDLRHIW
jgi:hypothetical protein